MAIIRLIFRSLRNVITNRDWTPRGKRLVLSFVIFCFLFTLYKSTTRRSDEPIAKLEEKNIEEDEMQDGNEATRPIQELQKMLKTIFEIEPSTSGVAATSNAATTDDFEVVTGVDSEIERFESQDNNYDVTIEYRGVEIESNEKNNIAYNEKVYPTQKTDDEITEFTEADATASTVPMDDDVTINFPIENVEEAVVEEHTQSDAKQTVEMSQQGENYNTGNRGEDTGNRRRQYNQEKSIENHRQSFGENSEQNFGEQNIQVKNIPISEHVAQDSVGPVENLGVDVKSPNAEFHHIDKDVKVEKDELSNVSVANDRISNNLNKQNKVVLSERKMEIAPENAGTLENNPDKDNLENEGGRLHFDGNLIQIENMNNNIEVKNVDLSDEQIEITAANKEMSPLVIHDGESVVQKTIRENMQESKDKKSCGYSPASLNGAMYVNQNITPTFEQILGRVSPDLAHGGCYKPSECQAVQKVAVIIPFKDREEHLKTLLFYLHPFLQRQRIHYCIIVSEQVDTGTFNKAMIMNAGYEEAMKLDDFDCIVFHDVDMIPEDDRNLYLCEDQPKHLSPAIDKFKYLLHYGTEFGGVTATRSDMYRKLNGHSNQFWGWGGEDNDMEYRIKLQNLTIIRANPEYGKYKMIPHEHGWKFAYSNLPLRLNKTYIERATTDGLSDLRYRLASVEKHRLYTKLYIDIRRIEITKMNLMINDKPAIEFELEKGPCRWEEFEDKYLDMVIELSTLRQIENMTIWPAKDASKHAPGEPRTFGELRDKGERFAMLHDKQQAFDLCEKLAHCRGVLREGAAEHYTLRKIGKPRHLTSPAMSKIAMINDHEAQLEMLRKIPTTQRTGYIRYCPGESSDMAIVRKPLLMHKDADQKNPENSYHFVIEFKVLMPIDKYMYYNDQREFESQYKRAKNRFIFSFPYGVPNVTDDYHPTFKFESPYFPIHNVPGTYTVSSVLEDELGQPFYKWNWWYEVTTGDTAEDALLRDVFYKRMVNTNMNYRKHIVHNGENFEEHKQKYKENLEEFNIKMAEIKKQNLRNALHMNKYISEEEKQRIEDLVMGKQDEEQ